MSHAFAAAAAVMAPSPLLRRAPAVARAPRRAGALPSVSPAAVPALRGLKVRPQKEEKEMIERERQGDSVSMRCIGMRNAPARHGSSCARSPSQDDAARLVYGAQRLGKAERRCQAQESVRPRLLSSEPSPSRRCRRRPRRPRLGVQTKP